MRINADERAILHLPAGTDALLLEIMPASETLAVEEQFPTGGFFCVGEGIDGRAIGRRETKSGDDGKNQCQPADVFHG